MYNEVEDAGSSKERSSSAAPPHPDVAREPETQAVRVAAVENNNNDGVRSEYPATASADEDLKKENIVEKGDTKKPRPASSEGKEATR